MTSASNHHICRCSTAGKGNHVNSMNPDLLRHFSSSCWKGISRCKDLIAPAAAHLEARPAPFPSSEDKTRRAVRTNRITLPFGKPSSVCVKPPRSFGKSLNYIQGGRWRWIAGLRCCRETVKSFSFLQTHDSPRLDAACRKSIRMVYTLLDSLEGILRLEHGILCAMMTDMNDDRCWRSWWRQIVAWNVTTSCRSALGGW